MFNDYKTAEHRLQKAGTNDIIGMMQAFLLGMALAGLVGIIAGVLNAII